MPFCKELRHINSSVNHSCIYSELLGPINPVQFQSLCPDTVSSIFTVNLWDLQCPFAKVKLGSVTKGTSQSHGANYWPALCTASLFISSPLNKV